MSETSFSLKFTRDISACNLDNLVFESEEIDKLDFLNSVALPDNILSELAIHRNKAEKESFCISTYHPLFGAKKLHIFSVHSKTDSTKELVKILQEIDGDIAFYTSKKDAILPIMDALILGSYQFDQFLTKKHQKKMMLISPELHTDFLPIVEDRRQLLSSIYLVRDMVNMPPSQKYPKKLVEQIQSLPFHNTKVTVIDKKELEEKWFGCLLGVSLGSDRDPYVVIFERMIDTALPTYALAGKGVTFDAGGLQIKPDDAMLDMKSDMAGAATVIGTLLYLDSRTDLAGNIVAAIGLTENLLGGSAMKPLDILTSYNKKTVEVQHTDAEGRLVLADLFGYLESTYKPTTLISIATLTGAVIYGLGYNYAGIIGNDQNLIDQILAEKAGEERFWQLPLDADMIEKTKGEISDVKNVTSGYKAGSSMGAAFLAHFLESTPFVHLDIAGPAYRESAYSYFPKGATGFGVMSLVGVLIKK